MNSENEAVEAFSEAVLEAIGSTDKNQSDRAAKFEEALLKATERLSKEQIVKVLMFLITDHDLFFDIFEQSVSRIKTA